MLLWDKFNYADGVKNLHNDENWEDKKFYLYIHIKMCAKAILTGESWQVSKPMFDKINITQDDFDDIKLQNLKGKKIEKILFNKYVEHLKDLQQEQLDKVRGKENG